MKKFSDLKSWKDWAIYFAYPLLIIADFFRLDKDSNSIAETLLPLAIDALLIGITLWLLFRFTSKKKA